MDHLSEKLTLAPTHCPHCHKIINLFLIDWRNHLQRNPSTCIHCEKVWQVENNKGRETN